MGRFKPSSEFGVALSLLREEIVRSDLLPHSYAKYLPLLADGVVFFLRRLSPGRLSRILEQQMSLPKSTPTAARLFALLAQAPALHKLGQVVARDRRLSIAFRDQLQRLESLTPRTPVATVLRSLNHEFKNWRQSGIELAGEPLAEGSVAVIMPFVWRPGSPRSRRGVFKLLKPQIRQQLYEDLEIFSLLGEFLDQDCSQYHLPPLDYEDTFATIRELLFHEVQFEKEQAHLAEAARLYSCTPAVAIPELFPFCSKNLTAMERLDGKKLECAAKQATPPLLIQQLIQGLITTPIFSSSAAALFHADPHAGNLLRLPEDRLGVLDWSLTGRLGRPERIQLAQLLLGGLTMDQDRMTHALEQLSRQPLRANDLIEALESSLRELRLGALPGLTWLTALLDSLVLRAGLRPNHDLLLFRKSLLTLRGVVADLMQADDSAAGARIDQVVLAEFLNQWWAEWPGRSQMPLLSPSHRTHLSTADLFSVVWSVPAWSARWWIEAGRDMLKWMDTHAALNQSGAG